MGKMGRNMMALILFHLAILSVLQFSTRFPQDPAHVRNPRFSYENSGRHAETVRFYPHDSAKTPFSAGSGETTPSSWAVSASICERARSARLRNLRHLLDLLDNACPTAAADRPAP
jgi:hypothetical protein